MTKSDLSIHIKTNMNIYDVMRYLVPFVQFLKPPTLLKVTALHGCFSSFLNYTNGTKSRNASHLKIFQYKFFHSKT